MILTPPYVTDSIICINILDNNTKPCGMTAGLLLFRGTGDANDDDHCLRLLMNDKVSIVSKKSCEKSEYFREIID